MSAEEPDSEEIHLIRRSRNENPQVRAEAAANPKLPREFLMALKYDPDEAVRMAAQSAIKKRFPKTKV
ncbi:MAG: hypothetical protein KGH65_01030 [Candidatus Micrarchaeota archaeon]|nr:hypothetical protein [Candidatus Micrarchaeota archaeon]